MNNSNRLQVLEENYRDNQNGDTSGQTLKEYVELCAAESPGFFQWFFPAGDLGDFGTGMSDEQREEYAAFVQSL